MAIKKPEIRKTSEEKRNAIKQISAFGLPTNPSALGMSAKAIKEAFWAPILARNKSVLDECDRIVDEINAYLETVYLHVGKGEVVAIDDAYKNFLYSSESGLTALSNTTWRVLKNHLKSFNQNVQAVADRVREAKEHAENAAQSAKDAQGFASAAAASVSSAQSAAEAAEAAKTGATDAKTEAQSAAQGAAEAVEQNRAFAENALEQFGAVQGMYPAGSLTTYAFRNNEGKLYFGIKGVYTTLIADNDTIWMGTFYMGEYVGENALLQLFLKNIFSCRLVEIIIQAPSPNYFEDPYFFVERVGGCTTLTKGISGLDQTDDGNGSGYTRMIHARRIDETTGDSSIYHLKLSTSLGSAIRRAVEWGYTAGITQWEEMVPIVFNGYN